MRFAVVNPAGGTVSNVVVGDDLATVEAVVGLCVQETEATGSAGIGYVWDGAMFTAPPAPEPPLVTPEQEAALVDAGWTPPA